MLNSFLFNLAYKNMQVPDSYWLTLLTAVWCSQSLAQAVRFSSTDCFVFVSSPFTSISSSVLRLQAQCDVCLVETLSPPRGEWDPHSKICCCRLFALLYARLGYSILSLCSVFPSTYKHTTCVSSYVSCSPIATSTIFAVLYLSTL